MSTFFVSNHIRHLAKAPFNPLPANHVAGKENGPVSKFSTLPPTPISSRKDSFVRNLSMPVVRREIASAEARKKMQNGYTVPQTYQPFSIRIAPNWSQSPAKENKPVSTFVPPTLSASRNERFVRNLSMPNDRQEVKAAQARKKAGQHGFILPKTHKPFSIRFAPNMTQGAPVNHSTVSSKNHKPAPASVPPRQMTALNGHHPFAMSEISFRKATGLKPKSRLVDRFMKKLPSPKQILMRFFPR